MSLQGIKLKRVQDLADAQEFMVWFAESRPVLAVDTETTGLEWWSKDFTRLIQFGDVNCGWTLDLRMWKGLAAEALRKYDGPIVAHNAKFDMHAIEAAGLPLPPRHQWHDTFLMHALLYPLEFHGLKPVSSKLIDRHANVPGKQLDALMKANGWTWATVPYECLGYSVYGALDTVLCARLYELMKPQIDARFPQAYEREMMTSHIAFDMEKRGLRVDLDYTARLDARYRTEMADLLTKIQFLGVQNPNSGPQIEKALRLEAWEPTQFTDKGAPSLKKQVLQGLDHEVAQLILEYRWREKYSSYTEKILRTHDSGILYPSINTFEARTGRMSIGSDKKERGTKEVVSVPWQQIPHTYDVRRCVLPRHEGESLYAIDYDSQELRVAAHYAQDPGLIETINSGQDMHLFGASQMFQETITDKEDPRRNLAKMTAYLIVYGGGAEKLAQAANISVPDAQRTIDRYKATFPAMKKYMDRCVSMGRSRSQQEGRAYIETYGGRELEVDPDFLYKLCNGQVQGSCADVLKDKLIALDSAGLAEYAVIPVHDELVNSLPTDEGAELSHEIAEIMQELRAFSVPLTVEITGPKSSWGHCKLKSNQIGWDELQTAESAA